MQGFKLIDPKEISENVFKMIGDEWFLITAGDENSFNSMTASWGHMGFIWNKSTATCVIRPQRYTYGFIEKSDVYTLSFFGGGYRKELGFFGSKSGRDFDKPKETGLTPVFFDGVISYAEAALVLVCKKLYTYDLKPENFLEKGIIDEFYNNDFHRAYIGEIVKTYKKL